jgi:hypothetical protein
MMNANSSNEELARRSAGARLPIILTAALSGSIAHLAGASTPACIASILVCEFLLIVICLLP